MSRCKQQQSIDSTNERGADRTAGRSLAERRKLRWGAGLAVAALCLVTAAPPATAGRPRPTETPEPTFISNTILETTKRSTAVLPVVFQATDAASLATAVDVANQIGCGVHIDVSGSIIANLVLTPRCPDPDALGIRLRGPANLYGGIVANCQGSDCAWASVEGINVVANNDDAFDANYDGRLAVLDSGGEVDGAYSNVLTAHGRARILALATFGRSVATVSSPPLAFIQDSRAIVAGGGEFRTGTAAKDVVLTVGGGNPGSHPVVAVIGHRFRCGAPGHFSIGFEPGIGGHSELWWGNGNVDCPIDLYRGWQESASMTTFGSGHPMPLPFPIPAWVRGHEYLEVEIAY